MRKKIVISSFLKQILVGIVEDGRLAEFFIEKDENSRMVGNVYKGKVENVLPGIAAAFVDIGSERNAFLYVADAGDASTSIRKGQELIVQVIKEPEGTKGARVSTNIALPGRYLVLMPMESTVGVSRQIVNAEERSRLWQIGKLIRPEGMGLIIRTAAEGHTEEELTRDRDELIQLWQRLLAESKQRSAPALLYRDHDLVYRIMRDVVTEDTESIIVDQKWIYEDIVNLRDILGLPAKVTVDLYDGKVALFEQLGLNRDLEKATKRWVWLNSGGYLIIDQTEALVSIDVNTGKFVGKTDLAETILAINKEAAREIAKQLRLRNIGGIIIIDFIDMKSEHDRRQVLDTLNEALAQDKTKSQVFGFTHLGLVEMTRKKAKTRLSQVLETTCPHCSGTGRILSPEAIAINTAQRIYSLARETDVRRVYVECHPLVAAKLIGSNKELLKHMQNETGKEIKIVGCQNYELDQVEVSSES